jgi:thiol:disulfide interchange protein DsbC
MKLLPFVLLALLGTVSLSACAQPSPVAIAAKPDAQASNAAPTGSMAPTIVPGSPEAHARAAIRAINPKAEVDRVSPAPLAGFQEVIVGGHVVYVSNDGKYLMQGTLYDIATKTNLGETSMARVREKLLRTMPLSDRIVFASPAPKYTVTVFTDVECGYCRKLHSQISEYNHQGISVQYVAFPRMGLGSADFKKMVAVWCSADPKKALTDAKNDRPIPYRNCTNPVTAQYNMGQRMGLDGTPMILAADGTQLGGYLPPAELRAALDKKAAGGKPVVSTATGEM